MNLQYAVYKPNKKCTGCAFSFNLSEDKKSFWINAVQQGSYNENATTANKGTFKENAKNPEKSISVKLNQTELGGVIAGIRTFSPWDTFHTYVKDSSEIKTQIKLGIWERPNNPKGDAMSLSIVQGEKKFGIALEKGEAEVLRIKMEQAVLEME